MLGGVDRDDFLSFCARVGKHNAAALLYVGPPRPARPGASGASKL